MAASPISGKCADYLDYLNCTSGEIVLRSYQDGLSFHDLEQIAGGLEHHSSLQSLQIDGRPLFVRARALFRDDTIEEPLEGEGASEAVSKRFAARMVHSITGNSSLTELSLSHLTQDEVPLMLIENLFRCHFSLSSVSLINIEMAAGDFGSLCTALSTNSTITSLCLSGSIPADQVGSLASALKTNGVLQVLKLNGSPDMSLFEAELERNRHNLWSKSVTLFSLLVLPFNNGAFHRAKRQRIDMTHPPSDQARIAPALRDSSLSSSEDPC